MTALIKNKTSLEWIQVKDHCTKRLDEFHQENEGNLDTAETARVRGMIEFAKEVIALGVDEATIQIAKTGYID